MSIAQLIASYWKTMFLRQVKQKTVKPIAEKGAEHAKRSTKTLMSDLIHEFAYNLTRSPDTITLTMIIQRHENDGIFLFFFKYLHRMLGSEWSYRASWVKGGHATTEVHRGIPTATRGGPTPAHAGRSPPHSAAAIVHQHFYSEPGISLIFFRRLDDLRFPGFHSSSCCSIGGSLRSSKTILRNDCPRYYSSR